MRKTVDDILNEAGLERVEDEPGAAKEYAADSVASHPSPDAVSAPSIGSGKLEGKEDLVRSAADAFRQARAQIRGEKAGKTLPSTGGPVGAADTASGSEDADSDVQMVRVRPKRGSAQPDVAAEPKVVVVSRAQGRIVGHQG